MSAETKHTPGPWSVNKYGSVGAGVFGVNPIVADVEPLFGLDAQHGSHGANAALIAAAPAMYEALEAAESALEFAANEADWPDKVERKALKIVRAALALARGEG